MLLHDNFTIWSFKRGGKMLLFVLFEVIETNSQEPIRSSARILAGSCDKGCKFKLYRVGSQYFSCDNSG